MRILVFHGNLTQPSGGEVNARDWALGFKARGHKVAMYSPRLGPLAEQIHGFGIMVVRDPSALSDAPDVVMGSGVHELATLLARFPRAAGVQVAQQFDHWISTPCPLPQVVRHIAVDELNADMLSNAFGVPREKIRIVYNAVDMNAVVPRTAPLPARPRRMLVFAKHQSGFIPAVKEACASRDIEVECIGNWIGRPVENPLQIIPDYDLVFGSARTALEGAAGGAAVLVGDGRGFAGMLTTGNFDYFRRNNFGRETLVRPLTAELIGEEIDKYDAADAQKICDTVRMTAGLDRQLEQIEEIFVEAIDCLSGARPTREEMDRALATYLALHFPRVGEGEDSPRHRQFSKVAVSTLEQQQARLIALEERFTALLNEQQNNLVSLFASVSASLKHQQDDQVSLMTRVSALLKEQQDGLMSLEGRVAALLREQQNGLMSLEQRVSAAMAATNGQHDAPAYLKPQVSAALEERQDRLASVEGRRHPG